MKSVLPGLQCAFPILVLIPILFSSFSFPSDRRLPAIPDLPQAELKKFRPDVREQIGRAYQRLRTDPEDGETNGRLGMTLHAYQLFQYASVCYQRAVLLEPKSFRWSYYLAVVQAHSGKESEAFASLGSAVGLMPGYLPARLRFGEALLTAGRFEESGEVYEALLEQHPESAFSHYGLGRALEAQGQSGAALESYRRASELSPGFRAARYALGMIYLKLGQKAKSEEQLSLFRDSEQEGPMVQDPLLASISALVLTGDDHFYRGVRLEKQGRLQEALREYEQALEVDPDLWEAHSNLGLAYMALAKWDLTERHLGTAARIKPDRWESHNNLGIYLRKQNRYQEAADAFRKALEVNPFSADARSNLAEVFAARGRFDEAVRHFHLALENDPHHRLAHWNLGLLLQGQGKNTEAVSHLLKTIVIDDERTPSLMVTLANTYRRSGDPGKARHYLKEARQRAVSFEQRSLVANIDRLLKELEEPGKLQ